MPMINENVSLQKHHTFATLATARFAANLSQISDFKALRETATWQEYPRLVLGSGSNTLFQQDFPGLVLFNQIRGITVVNENEEHIWLKVGAGENWHELVQYCIDHNYAGIENLSLIPGTVGAAPIQNIGAYGVELESVFHELHAVELESAREKTFSHAECDFGYRYSIFKQDLAGHYCITHVTLRLDKTPVFHLDYGQIREVLDDLAIKNPSIRSISEAVMSIRRSKLPDPALLPNAGSFFKNPVISQAQFQSLLKMYPTIPHYPQDNNQVKIPAAWLIEQRGWRGKRCGRVGVHEHQALVLINYDQGTGEEICYLAQTIRSDIKKTFAIDLMPEVSII